MRHSIRRFLCIAASLALFLSLAACAKEEPQPDSSPAAQSTALPGAVPQENKIEYQTYQIPNFEIEFDCPADFASNITSNVISETEVVFSVSGEDRYGFYYIGEDDFGDVSGPYLGYRYKNYGSFGELRDPIQVYLQIIAPESMARDEFTALCEAVTNSLRLSDSAASAGNGAPSAPEGGDGNPALKTLKGGTYAE